MDDYDIIVFLEYWADISRLQTFDDREKFRKEAMILIAELSE